MFSYICRIASVAEAFRHGQGQKCMIFMLSLLLSSEAASSCRAADGIDWKEHVDLRRACEQFWTNADQITSFRARGTCMLSFSDGPGVNSEKERVVTATFSTACRNQIARLRMEYSGDRGMGVDDDRREILADGESISVASFSEKRRPKGCELELRKDGPGEYYKSTGALRNDVRVAFRNPFFKSIELIDRLAFKGKSSTDAIDTWRFGLPEGYQISLSAIRGDPSRLFRTDLFNKDGSLIQMTLVDWSPTGRFAKVRHLATTEFDASGKITEKSEVEISELEINVDLDDGELLMSDYAGCDSRRIIDRRPTASTPVLYFEGTSHADLKNKESLADVATSLVPLQQAGAGHAPVPVVLPDRSVLSKLLVINGVALVFIAVVIFIRRSRSK